MTEGRPRLTLPAAVAGVVAGDRAILARAITLVESTRPDDEAIAASLIDAILPRTGGAIRVGLTGVPGVGKSTLLDALGMRLLAAGHRVAVLAVDPSSAISGGSILGDKTRMERLAGDPRAFIRPSPAARTLGGVARRTREAMLLLEAAGFDVVLVETVGVGQSETTVAEMVDHFVVLTLPNSGDELQGIKKGVLELADVLAVNKADGDGLAAARRALQDLTGALRYLRRKRPEWQPPAMLVSALTGDGLDALWQAVLDHRAALRASGGLSEQRGAQQERWMWALIEDGLRERFLAEPRVAGELPSLLSAVRAGRLTATAAARQTLNLLADAPQPSSPRGPI